MKIGDIIYLGDNMAWHVRQPFIDWRGHVESADYNGFAKITEIQENIVTVHGLIGTSVNPNSGRSMPVSYQVTGDDWKCLSSTEPPKDWD